MLMALGMFIFETPTLAHDELQRKALWVHARSGRVGTRDATQYIGPGAETIALSGAVYTEIADGLVSIDTLRAMANAGEAFPLLDGTGMIFGNFVIEGIDERHAILMSDGRARRIDFTIDLLRVDETAPADGDPAA